MKTRTFVDQVDVVVRSGKGGDGAATFRREAMVMRGGPDGGDGGRGGDVVLRASVHVNSLISLFFDPHLVAEDGVAGSGRKCAGRRGKDLVVDVPPGTVVTDAETGAFVAEVTEPGARAIVARGGAGGFGNVHFKSSVNQAPTEHTPGGAAEERRLHFELKTIADAGLLGFPNAGKSSLLAALSSAQPKIASYPFTTLNPIVGVIDYPDWAQVRMADVPGIIEGASKGVGLGLAFLKHLERSRVLVFVIDMAGTDNRKPWEDYRTLLGEITDYAADLPDRPALVVANKMDAPEASANLAEFRAETGVDPIPVSCVTREGLEAFKGKLRELVKPQPRDGWHADASPVHPPLKDMPATDGEEISAEALAFAPFLKLDPPKKKKHPSRGNVH